MWPDVDVSLWAGTKRSLHLYSQMLGKIKLAVAPVEPNWMFTALHLSPRGLTTGTIPWRGSSFEVLIDVFSSEIVVSRSNGARAEVPLLPRRSVAEVYSDLKAALESLGIACEISTIPQEISDTTPLDQDHRISEYDPGESQVWFAATTAVSGVFDTWRQHFFGRAGLQFWWGGFDVALMLFSGHHVPAPTDRGYIMEYDLDAELMNVGLYYGDAQTPPFFYGYIYPEPKSAESLPIAPAQASWSSAFNEWVLPYQAVRESPDPAAMLRSFIDAIYDLCFSAAGWRRDEFLYRLPPIAVRR
jgi:hypothetical protein